VETVIVVAVAPVDHVIPEVMEDVNVTLPPIQNDVGPPGVMVGVAALGRTFTVTGEELADVQPLTVCVTV
jgi:hypothetical protein